MNKDWETPSEAERDAAKQELAKAGQATDDVAGDRMMTLDELST